MLTPEQFSEAIRLASGIRDAAQRESTIRIINCYQNGQVPGDDWSPMPCFIIDLAKQQNPMVDCLNNAVSQLKTEIMRLENLIMSL